MSIKRFVIMLYYKNLKCLGQTKYKSCKNLFLIILLIGILDQCGIFSYLFATSYDYKNQDLDRSNQEILDILNRGGTPKTVPINSYNYTFRIANSNKCKLSSDSGAFEEITLLILIKSAIPHLAQRNAIRNSWGFEGRFSDVKIRKLFLLGTGSKIQDQIDDENTKHNDIIQSDFIDSYYNNTIKSMMGIKWTITNCPKTQFVLLVDDDMYVSVKNLLKFVRNPLGVKMISGLGLHINSGKEDTKEQQIKHRIRGNGLHNRRYDGRLYGGYVFPKSLPIRYKFSKWYISLEEYPYSRYPPYVTAGAVAFSFPAIRDMYHMSLYTKHFRFDDIYLAMLAAEAGIKPIPNEGFHYHKKSYDLEGYADVIVSHGYEDPSELHKVWLEQKSRGNA